MDYVLLHLLVGQVESRSQIEGVAGREIILGADAHDSLRREDLCDVHTSQQGRQHLHVVAFTTNSCLLVIRWHCSEGAGVSSATWPIFNFTTGFGGDLESLACSFKGIRRVRSEHLRRGVHWSLHLVKLSAAHGDVALSDLIVLRISFAHPIVAFFVSFTYWRGWVHSAAVEFNDFVLGTMRGTCFNFALSDHFGLSSDPLIFLFELAGQLILLSLTFPFLPSSSF